MTTLPIPHTPLVTSRIAYGCMKLGGSWNAAEPITAEQRSAAFAAIEAALETGCTLFDHADIYCAGKSETIFGEFLRAHRGLRERIVLQSKCGIRAGRYDFSREHILASVDGILSRLGVERIDILLLHRPDPLVEPEEVAAAFDALQASGKVAHFGVSNHGPMQIELLRRHLRQPLVVNQLELSLAQAALISEGIHVNQARGLPTALATGVLDYCRLHDIRVQAWAPVGGGRLLTPPTDAPVPEVTRLIHELSTARGVSGEAILLAWLLRHPAGIQPVVGSLRPERIRASAEAERVKLSREEWYALFTATQGKRVP